MYGFRTLNAEYLMGISIEQDGKPKSSLEVVYTLESRYQNIEETFLFTLNRKKVKLDTKKRECDTLVDRMMQRLGDALFPVSLIVSKDANVIGIKYFDKISARWNEAANAVLNEAYSVPTEKYIDMAKANIINEEKFVDAFCRQSFCQLLFRDSKADSFWFTTKNLAGVCTTDSVRCDKISEKSNTVCFETVGDWSTGCRFEYAFSEYGDILSIEGDITKELADNGGMVTKHISIRVDDDRREVKKANKLMSFLMD